MKTIYLRPLTLILCVLLFNQCRKTQNNGQINTGNEVTTSLCGLVLDETGAPLQNAFIQCGGKNTMTDVRGLYILNQVSTLENKTQIEITKSGYFKSYKTLLVKQGQQQFTKCILLKKDNSQFVNAAAGGNVAFGNEVSIAFPPNALVDKNTGQAYIGQAEIILKYIDPTTQQGLMSMPGNLTALDVNQNEKVLASYGMFAAEIFDQSGNSLQIKSGEHVQISVAIPPSMQASASQLIPLWYFDETKAIWVEEGQATLSGNKYTGQISHFSFWNCDAPKEFIKLEMIVVDQNNFPLSGKQVQITDLADNSKASGVTDAKGWVGGKVPGNANLKVDVLSPDICGAIPIYSTNITTGTTAKNLGVVIVNVTGINMCHLSGKLVNCNQGVVSKGMVYIDGLQEVIFTNQTGHFSYSLPCTPGTTTTIFCHDMSNDQYDSTLVNLIPGENNLGNLNACGLYGKFLNLTIKKVGTTDSFSIIYRSPTELVSSSDITVDLTPNCILLQAGLWNSQQNLMFVTSNPFTMGQQEAHLIIFYKFSGPSNIFTDTIWTPYNPGFVNLTSISPFPGDVTGYFEIPAKGSITNQDYILYGDFRLPKFGDF